MAKTYDLAGQYFTTQKALEATVKEIIRGLQMDTVFKNDLLREIVNTLHQDVKDSGQRSTGEFEFVSWQEQEARGLAYSKMFRGGPVMMTRFEPLGEWRDVTVYPWRRQKPKAAISAALRVKATSVLPFPPPDARCSYPGCSANYHLHYHHVAPTFEQILEECLPLVSTEEMESLFGYSKFAPGVFDVSDCIPNDHPAVLRLIELHKTNEWAWLCEYHHVMSHHGGEP